jgi:hypothetical protein
MAEEQPVSATTVRRGEQAPPGFGLRLHRKALAELRRIGVHAEPPVSLVHQPKADHWTLRGEESGGAGEQIGHYVAFVGVEAGSLVRAQPIQTIIPNAIHRIVIAQALVRFEMYRFNSTYDLMISLHWIEPQPGSPRPAHRRTNVFVGRLGMLNEKLWTAAGAPYRGEVKPRFFGRSGEEIDIPEILHDGVYRITEAVCCVGCKHAHFFDALNVAVDIPVKVSATQLAAPASKTARRRKKQKGTPQQPTPPTQVTGEVAEVQPVATSAGTESTPALPG